MKRKNLREGLHVVVKDGAGGFIGDYLGGKTIVVDRVDADGYVWVDTSDISIGYHSISFSPKRVRKATPEEIAIYEQEKLK